MPIGDRDTRETPRRRSARPARQCSAGPAHEPGGTSAYAGRRCHRAPSSSESRTPLHARELRARAVVPSIKATSETGARPSQACHGGDAADLLRQVNEILELPAGFSHAPEVGVGDVQHAASVEKAFRVAGGLGDLEHLLGQRQACRRILRPEDGPVAAGQGVAERADRPAASRARPPGCLGRRSGPCSGVLRHAHASRVRSRTLSRSSLPPSSTSASWSAGISRVSLPGRAHGNRPPIPIAALASCRGEPERRASSDACRKSSREVSSPARAVTSPSDRRRSVDARRQYRRPGPGAQAPCDSAAPPPRTRARRRRGSRPAGVLDRLARDRRIALAAS